MDNYRWIWGWDNAKKRDQAASCQWLIPIILATWKAETRRIVVQGQSGKVSLKISRQNGLEV
jgi:hypothetical protein